ncbi:MAG: hypothetical protein R2712_15710 [Vicinamibacterales bacterium]
MRALLATALAAIVLLSLPSAQAPLDRDARRWVDETLARLDTDARIGQLPAPGFESTYLPSDSDEYTTDSSGWCRRAMRAPSSRSAAASPRRR